MPAIESPTQDEIDTWELKEAGVKSGSSPSESFEVDESSADRVFFCRWDKRKDVFKWFLGYGRVYTSSGDNVLSRLMPQRHPSFPDLIAVKIRNVEGHRWKGNAYHLPDADVPEGEDPETYYYFTDLQINVYDRCRFTVVYEHAPHPLAIDEDTTSELQRYVWIEGAEPGADYLNFPGAAFKFWRESGTAAPNGQSIPYNAGRVVPLEVFRVVWDRLPETNAFAPGTPLFQRIYGVGELPYLRTVNQTAWFGRPPGTCLFSAIRPTYQKSPTGVGRELRLGRVD